RLFFHCMHEAMAGKVFEGAAVRAARERPPLRVTYAFRPFPEQQKPRRHELSKPNLQLLTFNLQLSICNLQLSICNLQLSSLNSQYPTEAPPERGSEAPSRMPVSGSTIMPSASPMFEAFFAKT